MAEKEYLNEDLELKLLQELDEDEAEMYSRKCTICGKRQFKLVLPPKEVEIELWMWYRKCWKCGKVTPVVWISPNAVIGEFNVDPDSFEELQENIAEKYSFFKLTYSKTQGMQVYGNICIHCNAYQGNWYIREDLIEIAYYPEKIKEKTTVRIRLTEKERFDRAYPEEVIKLEQHHLSYFPEEIILVCRKCHRKIHLDDDLKHLRPEKS